MALNNSNINGVPRPQASEIVVNTSNGFGSVATQSRRFSRIISNRGGDITYIDSPTLGAIFKIRTSGNYSVSYSDGGSAAVAIIGIIKNRADADVAGAISNPGFTFPDTVLISGGYAQLNTVGSVCVDRWLEAGDTLYPAKQNADGDPAFGPSLIQFSIQGPW